MCLEVDKSAFAADSKTESVCPLVSIVVPIYKVERWLEKCVDSIIRQTYANLEIILVDDGSPDACPAICDGYAEKDSRVKVFHKENGGLVSARKYGVERAEGEYLFWVDGDDWICADCIEKMVRKAEAMQSDIVWCDVQCVYTDRVVTASIDFVADPNEMLHRLLERKVPGWLWNKLIRMKFYYRSQIHYSVGDDMLEDLYQSVQLLAGNPIMAHVEEFLYCYNRMNEGAFTAASTQVVILKRGMPNILHVYDYLQDHTLLETYKNSFAYQAMSLKVAWFLGGDVDNARQILPFAHKIPQAYPVYGLVRILFYIVFNGGIIGKWIAKFYLRFVKK